MGKTVNDYLAERSRARAAAHTVHMPEPEPVETVRHVPAGVPGISRIYHGTAKPFAVGNAARGTGFGR